METEALECPGERLEGDDVKFEAYIAQYLVILEVSNRPLDYAFFFSYRDKLLALVINVEFSWLNADLVFQNRIHEKILINEQLALVSQIKQSELYFAHVVVDLWWYVGPQLHERLKIRNPQALLSQIDVRN